MERVTEYFPEEALRTRLFIGDLARKEMDKWCPDELGASLQIQAEKGFQEYQGSALRDEGQGVFAFGKQTWTVRIAGFFQDSTRDVFVIGGVWKGKSGRGNSRPSKAEAVVNRVARMKREGVEYVQ